MNKTLLLGLLTVAVAAPGCAKKTKHSGDGVSRYNRVSVNPVRITTQVKNCSRVQAQSANKLFSLDLFLDGRYLDKQLDFTGILNNQRLRSTSSNKIITDTDYNYEQLAIYSGYYDQAQGRILKGELIGGNIITDEKDVTICPGVSDYNKNTVENASLSINYTITKTNNKVKTLFPTMDIEPVTVKVTPLYGEKVKAGKRTQTSYMTDNAFYLPTDNTIQFLPQSKEGLALGVFGKIPVWEIPMVASHEYGHHLFATIYPRSQSAEEELSLKGHELCFDNRVDHVHHAKHVTRNKNVDFDTVLGAFNEGFADLVSFYSLENDERALTDIKCMETSRDVDSSIFHDGVSKTFDSDNLDIFFGVADQETKSCGEADFTGIHDIGAVFAHAVDSIMSLYSSNKDTKLKVTINWLKKLNEKHYDLDALSTRRQLNAIYLIFIKEIFNEFGDSKKATVCQYTKYYHQDLDYYTLGKFLKECE